MEKTSRGEKKISASPGCMMSETMERRTLSIMGDGKHRRVHVVLDCWSFLL